VPRKTTVDLDAKIPRALVLTGTWIIKRLLRAGVPMGPMILLTVRGRTTGRPRTTPVDLFERDGRRWLVATHGEGNWARNLRAVGEGVLTHGRRRQAVTAVELPLEAAGPVLKEVVGPRLASPVGGSILRRTLDVAADASLDDFISVARRHPVFELGSPHEPPS
jgi:deazaflavin-dependent oxidoreductase (nitroreductase family)